MRKGRGRDFWGEEEDDGDGVGVGSGAFVTSHSLCRRQDGAWDVGTVASE